MNFRILIADDEKNIRDGIVTFLLDEGYEVESVANGKEAIAKLNEGEYDLVLTDMRMGPVGGEALLQHVITRYPTVPVVILTGHGSVESAVESIQKGAYDYITKPVNLDHLLVVFRRALKTRELSLQNRQIREELNKLVNSKLTTFQSMSHSKAMQVVNDKIQSVAPAHSSVLITGESGVGKEVLCNTIHQLSGRKDGPLIKVHCAALSESLLESELFGHERGSFTGAISQKKGRFELAHNGTIFLDEIGEIDNNLQVKLLRVLQEQEFERVGGEKPIKVDVRIIAATNKDFKKEVAEGRFREDLYYRLSVVNIHVPPLRERGDEILFLAQSFLHEFSQENNKQIEGFDKPTMQILLEHSWPGNIRELRNCVESAVVMSRGKFIVVDDLPDSILNQSSTQQKVMLPLDISMQEAERIIIRAYLIKYKNNKSRVAEVLDMSRKTLHNKIKEYRIPDLKENSEKN